MSDFYYPYSFIRTPDRKALLDKNFVGDSDPSLPENAQNHERYWPGRYAGEILVTLVTETPLFITDPESKRELPNGHVSYACLEEIPATALKGMLSSAYEIITNSRYRVFSENQHKDCLVYRSPNTRHKERYQASPWECLVPSLRPAENIGKLSPADRLFGWVSQDGNGAWRGKVRIASARYTGGGSPLESVPSSGDNGRPLAILGTPKPAQARFYCGDRNGRPQQDGFDKDAAGYAKQKRLRGRKVYLHHQGKADPFHPKGEKSDQNRSIRNWIPKGKTFEFTIRFENLTAEEAGALLVLLLVNQEKAFFRLGYGKPLGLGSVKLSANPKGIRIYSGDMMKKRYERLDGAAMQPLAPEERRKLIDLFYDAIDKAYPQSRDSLLEGFLRAGQGVPNPVAYSVIDGKPDEPSFQWFVENDRPGRRRSLPEIGKPLPSYPKQERGRRR